MSFKVYVASPFLDAGLVRGVHRQLAGVGIGFTSTWAENADGPEVFDDLTLDQIRSIAHQNDRDIASADAMLVLSRPSAGGETFAEARFALILQIPVVWVGRRILSAWREGVTRVESLDDAIEELVRMRSAPRIRVGAFDLRVTKHQIEPPPIPIPPPSDTVLTGGDE